MLPFVLIGSFGSLFELGGSVLQSTIGQLKVFLQTTNSLRQTDQLRLRLRAQTTPRINIT